MTKNKEKELEVLSIQSIKDELEEKKDGSVSEMTETATIFSGLNNNRNSHFFRCCIQVLFEFQNTKKCTT